MPHFDKLFIFGLPSTKVLMILDMYSYSDIFLKCSGMWTEQAFERSYEFVIDKKPSLLTKYEY